LQSEYLLLKPESTRANLKKSIWQSVNIKPDSKFGYFFLSILGCCISIVSFMLENKYLTFEFSWVENGVSKLHLLLVGGRNFLMENAKQNKFLLLSVPKSHICNTHICKYNEE
jgi:hypothetical protein